MRSVCGAGERRVCENRNTLLIHRVYVAALSSSRAGATVTGEPRIGWYVHRSHEQKTADETRRNETKTNENAEAATQRPGSSGRNRGRSAHLAPPPRNEPERDGRRPRGEDEGDVVRAERCRGAVLREHVDERRKRRDDLRGGREELEEQNPPHHPCEVGYWGLGQPGIVRRSCSQEQAPHVSTISCGEDGGR